MASNDLPPATPKSLPPHLPAKSYVVGKPNCTPSMMSISGGSGSGSDQQQHRQQRVTGPSSQRASANLTGRADATGQIYDESSAREMDGNLRNLSGAAVKLSPQRANSSSSSPATGRKAAGGSNRDIGPQGPNGFTIQRPNRTVDHEAYRPTINTQKTPTSKIQKGNDRGVDPSNALPSRQKPKGPIPQINRSRRKEYSHQNVHPPATPPWLGKREARFRLKEIPAAWGTQRVHERMYDFGNVTCIEIYRDRRIAEVVFMPPPEDLAAIYRGIYITKEESASVHPREIELEYVPPYKNSGTCDPEKKENRVTVKASRIDFGVMKEKTEMLGLHTVQATLQESVEFSVNKTYRRLEIHFSVPSSMITYDPRRLGYVLPHQLRYQMQINFTQLPSIARMQNERTGETAFVFSIDAPPIVYWRSHIPRLSHDGDATRWTEWKLWFRQVEIEQDMDLAKHAVKQLQRESPIIDIGRWLTYRFVFNQKTTQSQEFKELKEALEAHSIPLTDFRISPTFAGTKAMQMYSWLDSPVQALHSRAGKSSISDLQQMTHETIQLPFAVRYQLESCISHGCLQECNIDKAFLERLSAVALENEHSKVRLVKILEKVVEEGRRFYNPHDIFKQIVPNMRNALKQWQQAASFVKVLTGTVTPTTMYFNPPSLEPSNRVIRHFRQYEDRFLRVRFTDERYKGKIFGSEENQDNDIFYRVKRTMVNGIKVGDRVFEFLAFGNSQFRENGAYFFAPIGDLNAQKIRDWMGDFSSIKVIAKYCSRIGQSLSTTRASPYRSFNRIDIPDIERNGFCFTDGVGKISVMLAKLLTSEAGMLRSSSTGAGNDQPYASAYQFRMEGCKGVLVVDPMMGNDMAVAIRPSQEKFTVMNNTGLEICRISQFTNASLNVQIILVLSVLGVRDQFFTGMMRKMLSDLETAMTDESKAVELLQKNIDQNQMTVQVAQMILDGFMETKDPFMISCLRLWRAWSLKFLKEKQRIFVEDGAFVLGCIDETNTLEGHYNNRPKELAEIFLQIPDRGKKGQYKVLEGICVLARNPSLHPGDVRVVRAVKCDKLMHIRDCVVLPQKGDRDLANMCSGGDLDGDDYMVLWDKDLLPKQWNHPPMDYKAPSPEEKAEINVNDITSFYVTHMKYNNVGRIAVLHRCWADRNIDGVKSQECLKLAELHSNAVDYAKTGVPAKLSKSLQLSDRPHWNGGKKIYKSNKVIGQLYDMVKREDFVPAWDLPFDRRILEAYSLSNDILEAAKDVKQEYDEAIRRVMAKFGIHSEFEVWSTFVLEHANDFNDYKFGEKIGEEIFMLKEGFQKLCHERISSEEKEQKDWTFKGPFIAAMYAVTASEVSAALAECEETKIVSGEEVPVMQKSAETMPPMSFPWLFPTELGWIATKKEGRGMSMPMRAGRMPGEIKKKRQEDAIKVKEMLGEVEEPKPLQEVVLPGDDGLARNNEHEVVEVDIWGDKSRERPTASKMSVAGKTSIRQDSIVSLAIPVSKSEVSAVSSDNLTAAPPRKTSAMEDLNTSLMVTSTDLKTESPSPPLYLDGDLLDFDVKYGEPSTSVSPPQQAAGSVTSDRNVLELGLNVAENEPSAFISQPVHAAAFIPTHVVTSQAMQASTAGDETTNSAEEEDDGETEEVVLSVPAARSAFDALEEMVGC